MPRPLSIRRSLLTDLVILIVLLGAAILTTTFVSARRTVFALTSRTIDRAMSEVKAELDGFFRPIDGARNALVTWIEAGTLDPTDADAVARLVAPAFARLPHLRSIAIGDATGAVLAQERTADGFRQRVWPGPIASADDPEERAWRHGDEPVARLERRPAPETEDPRRSTVWTEALARADDTGIWSEPLPRAETALPALHLASATDDAIGRRSVVLLDVDLEHLNAFLDDLNVSPGGSAFVLTEDGRLLGLPSRFTPKTDAPPAADPGGLLRHPADLGITVLQDAADAFAARPLGERVNVPFQFRSEGTTWWASLDAYELPPSRRIFVAGLVPRADILPDLADTRLTITLIVVVVLAGAVVRVLVLSRRFSRPIEAVVAEAQLISRGDLHDRPAVRSRIIEVRRLSAAIFRMRKGLRSLLKLEDDLRIARSIQQRTFPGAAPEAPGFDVAGHSQPADETGGDSYDFVPFEADGGHERLLVLLADATGHGIGPALSVTQVRSMVRMGARLHTRLELLLDLLNQQLCIDLPAGHFITAWLGVLEPETRRLRWFSAGQAPLLHYVAAEARVVVFDADTFPLGIQPELNAHEASHVVLAPGDAFLVPSDGFHEAPNPTGALFGIDRMTAVFRDRARAGASANAIIEALRDAVARFAESESIRDDQTAIVIRALPSSA